MWKYIEYELIVKNKNLLCVCESVGKSLMGLDPKWWGDYARLGRQEEGEEDKVFSSRVMLLYFLSFIKKIIYF